MMARSLRNLDAEGFERDISLSLPASARNDTTQPRPATQHSQEAPVRRRRLEDLKVSLSRRGLQGVAVPSPADPCEAASVTTRKREEQRRGEATEVVEEERAPCSARTLVEQQNVVSSTREPHGGTVCCARRPVGHVAGFVVVGKGCSATLPSPLISIAGRAQRAQVDAPVWDELEGMLEKEASRLAQQMPPHPTSGEPMTQEAARMLLADSERLLFRAQKSSPVAGRSNSEPKLLFDSLAVAYYSDKKQAEALRRHRRQLEVAAQLHQLGH